VSPSAPSSPSSAQHAESVWVRLAGCYHAVLPAARSAVGPDLTLPQFDVLAQLARCAAEGQECTPGGLSRMLLVTAGNVTGVVERLAARGLIARDPDPGDRRRVRLRLTRAGRAAWEQARARHAQALGDRLSVLPPAVLRRLRDVLGEVRDAFATGTEPAKESRS
jgi:DNA-binding MarR family transcriptional regulator